MNKRKIGRCIVTLGIAVCLLFTNFVGNFLYASAANVVPSTEDYAMSFQGFDVYFGNAQEAKPGTEVYLTYTVEEVRAGNESLQNGVIATDQPEIPYPYLEGGVLYSSNESPLLEEGATYFFRFKYTEEAGFEYVAAKAKGDESKYIVFDYSTANHPDYPYTDKSTYFGVWFGGVVSVKLKNVHCYDKEGNDLGVYAPKHHLSLLDDVKSMSKTDQVDHTYNIRVEDGRNVALSNKKPTDADTVYMEYTVQKSDATSIYQYGLINHNAEPNVGYPHAENGSILVESMYEGTQLVKGPGYLLQEGASYIIRFERKSQYFIGLVQKTYQGKTELREFTNVYGDYIYGAPFFALWFGEGPECPVTFELTDFKCYDAAYNNLGVQANNDASTNHPVQITHTGEIEDYSGCEAMYYDRESESVIALYADKTAKVTRDGKTDQITYRVREGTLDLIFSDKTETYEYYYQSFTDDAGRTYRRLGTYQVQFVTGTEETIEKQIIDGVCGYMAAKPKEPTKKGAEFLGWRLSDGTDYEFEKIVDQSITLYAKWSDETEYQTFLTGGFAITPQMTAIAVSAVILIAGAVCGGLILKRSKRNDKAKEKTN